VIHITLQKHIIPAIIAKSQDELNEKILKVKDYAKFIQLDVMDGEFVPNASINFPFKLPETNCYFEAHLMIRNPKKWCEQNFSKVDTILAHIESYQEPTKLIDFVKEKKKRVGFVLNPETSLQKIASFLEDIDQVLIMTVNPGFYGSPFLPEMLEKIQYLRGLQPELDIEVDGGITDKTIGLVNQAGANMFVSGSYLVKSSNVKQSFATLQSIIKKC
jgi:ribulose-phosphate 3-epimerase